MSGDNTKSNHGYIILDRARGLMDGTYYDYKRALEVYDYYIKLGANNLAFVKVIKTTKNTSIGDGSWHSTNHINDRHVCQFIGCNPDYVLDSDR